MAVHEVTSRAIGGGPAPGTKRRRLIRLSFGHVLMIAAGLLAFLINLSFLRSVDDRVLVAVAGRDLEAGTTVSPADFRLEPVGAEAAVLEQLIPEDRLPGLDGILARDLRAGALLDTADVVPTAAPDGLRAMSIPIDIEHAVGGALRPGDLVDVVAVEDGAARYVLVGAEVLAVSGGPGGPLGSPRGFFLTVGVDADEALALAAALDSASVEVVLATGARPAEPTGPVGADPDQLRPPGEAVGGG